MEKKVLVSNIMMLKEKQRFSQKEKCKNLTERPEHFFDVKVTFGSNLILKQ